MPSAATTQASASHPTTRHATSSQAATAQHASSSSRRVIPVVDVSLGTVTLVVNGRLERYKHNEPRLLARALSQAVRPARWFPDTRTLTLTVAAAGHHAGLERHFSFASDNDARSPWGGPLPG